MTSWHGPTWTTIVLPTDLPRCAPAFLRMVGTGDQAARSSALKRWRAYCWRVKRPSMPPEARPPPEVDLIALRRDLIAQRAREAAQRPGTITSVIDRLASPLDRVGPGR